MESTPSKRGLSFIAVRDYVLRAHAEAGWSEVLRRLPAAEGEALRSVVGIGWYSLERYAHLLRTVDSTFGAGDLSTIAAVIHFEAERDLPTVHRMLLRIVRPTFIIGKMAELWSRYNSTGRFSIVERGPRSVDAVISDWSDDRALCLGTQYYCERALELAGARGARVVQTRCRAKGDPVCQLHGSWGAKAL